MGDAAAAECRECKKREEHIYWTCFQSVHFFLPLAPPFRHRLAIPEKFVNNVREKLADAVTIKGPSGALWEVELTSDNSTLFFGHGWQNFVEDHSLEEDDVLFFKFIGNSCFEVKMFDCQTYCEKEASYFVRKCEHQELANLPNMNVAESFDVTDDASHEANKPNPSIKHRSEEGVQTPEPARSTQATRRRLRSANNTVLDGRQGTSSVSSGYPVQFVSNRRSVTEEEKHEALQRANAAHSASAKSSFIVVMRATHVYKTFFMSIPAEWLYSHLPINVNEVILRMQGKTWYTGVYRKTSGGGLMSGWKPFALENGLEEDDVCLFQLDDEASRIVLDVQIFRVVEKVVAPTRLTSTKSTSTNARGRTTSKRPRKL